VKSWSSASLVKFALKSTSSHYFTAFLCCPLAVGSKQLGQAARGAKREMHGAEERQIAQHGTTANLALRKHFCCSSPSFSIDVGTSILASPGLHAHVASYKMMNGLSDESSRPIKNTEYLA
jgi:hypothetical protein